MLLAVLMQRASAASCLLLLPSPWLQQQSTQEASRRQAKANVRQQASFSNRLLGRDSVGDGGMQSGLSPCEAANNSLEEEGGMTSAKLDPVRKPGLVGFFRQMHEM